MPAITLLSIIRAVCARVGVTHDEIASKKRNRNVVLARMLIAALARQHTTESYPRIAYAIRRREATHSSVIAAYQRYEAKADGALDPTLGLGGTLRELFESIENDLTGGTA